MTTYNIISAIDAENRQFAANSHHLAGTSAAGPGAKLATTRPNRRTMSVAAVRRLQPHSGKDGPLLGGRRSKISGPVGEQQVKDLLVNRGWEEHGPRRYCHHCGASIIQCDDRTWIAETVKGNLHNGLKTVEEAIVWTETHDPDFWTLGRVVSSGEFGGIGIESVAGYLNREETKYVIALSIPEISKLPTYLQRAFKKHFFSLASCAKCGRQGTEIKLLPLRVYGDRAKELTPYVVCNCGYPVWRISQDDCYRIERRLARSQHNRENAKQRKEFLSITGGKHTKREIQEILTLQENRCFYCNIIFADMEMPTRDHLIPIRRGGTDWALNIVMACRSCNSRRNDTHFLTYCKRLSRTQNQRILKHFCRRVEAIRLEHLPLDGLIAFSRFKQICSRFAKNIAEVQRKNTSSKKSSAQKERATTSVVRNRKEAVKRKPRVADILKAAAKLI